VKGIIRLLAGLITGIPISHLLTNGSPVYASMVFIGGVLTAFAFYDIGSTPTTKRKD
jgi:hypothetical protein